MANVNFIVQNGINIGGSSGANISVDPTTGAIVFAPAPTASVPNPTATVFTTTGAVQTVATTGGVVSGSAVATANAASATTLTNSTANITVNTANITMGVGGTQVWTVTSSGVTAAGTLTVTGNLTVNGTTTTVNNETILLTETANAAVISYLSGNSSVNSGNIQVAASIVPSANATYNLGTASSWYNNIYGTATHSLYADLAENYQADRFYNPGTVLMFGGVQEVTIADADTTRVAGVVSTNPAHLMNGALSGPNVTAVAFTGRVPCQVIGPVAKGDLMVSAGFGYAKVNNTPQVGTVIGKALQDFQIAGKGVIEVVVGRF
jgi:hypothetical protein